MSTPPVAPLDRFRNHFPLSGRAELGSNFGGKVHGGALMKWIDETAYACSAVWSGRYCVTVSVGKYPLSSARFWSANLVELARPGRGHGPHQHAHSCFRAGAGDPKGGELLQTTDCLIVMVARQRERPAGARAGLRAGDGTNRNASPGTR